MRTEKKEPLCPSMIKNKEKRSEVHAKLKHQKKLEKRAKAKACDAAMKRALELGEELPEKKVPHTIENTRELDETVCKPDDEEPGSAYALRLALRLPVSFRHRFFGHFFSRRAGPCIFYCWLF